MTGSLTLGSLPTLAADPLAGLVGRFRTVHPGVLVDLAAPEDTADLAELLQTASAKSGSPRAPHSPPDSPHMNSPGNGC